MSGIRYAGSTGGGVGVPDIIAALLAGGSAGGVQMYSGDFVVRTIKTTLTANVVPVIRTLLAADQAANYQQGGANAGILGLLCEDVITNSSGQPLATPPPIANGASVIYPYSYDGLLQLDPLTLRGQGRVIECSERMIYGIKLDAASAAGTMALVGTLAALKLTGTLPTVFTVDTTAATTNVLRIIGINTSDPLYGAVGCEVFVQVLGAYCQSLTAVPYSTN